MAGAKERRLFAYLLSTATRAPTQLSESFIEGLEKAFDATDDPATNSPSNLSQTPSGPWRLHSIETVGFGGLNTWNGPRLKFDLDCESVLFEGPNGSGKSSFVAAIIWALSGERPRDQAKSDAHERKAVLNSSNVTVGDWPPIACYPSAEQDLKSAPAVSVKLIFSDPVGSKASVERSLSSNVLSYVHDPILDIPSVLMEAGILMPARLAALRFDDGRGRLTEAVEKLTGLDDLIAIGALVEGLCHKSREYQSYRRKEFESEKQNFDNALAFARNYLSKIEVIVPDFACTDTDDVDGDLAKLGRELNQKAAQFTEVISEDLSKDLDLTKATTQHQIITAISMAETEALSGVEALASWKKLSSIASALPSDVRDELQTAIVRAKAELAEAIDFKKRSEQDAKFQLKAVAARWCEQHGWDEIEECPLCTKSLASVDPLTAELNALRAAGAAATRVFDDNITKSTAMLSGALPPVLQRFGEEILVFDPANNLTTEIRSAFVSKSQYAQTLTTFCERVDAALVSAPRTSLQPSELALENPLQEEIAFAERLIGLANWFDSYSHDWLLWWSDLCGTHSDDSGTETPESLAAADPVQIGSAKKAETLMEHLTRLSAAISKAEPYRDAADQLRSAWKAGVEASKLLKVITKREEIGSSLSGLKSLGSLAESVARDAIEGLSGRMGALLEKTLLTENLKFKEAALLRKEGLIVRGSFAKGLQIDATLVANTSWLRAVLWAFMFSLRAEAVEQAGKDVFPLLVFDDPQLTFDSNHRLRWAQVVAALQESNDRIQVIITTHDEAFLELSKVAGVKGRQILLAAAGKDLGHVGIFEGDLLERKWIETLSSNTPKAGQDYLQEVRRYVEGMLRHMLRDESATVLSVVTGFAVGDSRAKIEELHRKQIAPWDRSEFKALAKELGKDLSAIKHMEIAHHAGASNLGMAEATDVHDHWAKKLKLVLDRAFRLAQRYHSLHGRSALVADPPSSSLPEGYKAAVQAIPLNVLGRAAALSDGRMADGLLDFDEYEASAHKKITLAQHLAYRISSPTLEPVARVGDILLIKDAGEPTPRSLVVALTGDRVLARRFEIADNHSDIAVLTAQSISPRQIAAPVIAQKQTLTLHKVVGVIYCSSSLGACSSQSEIAECTGTSVISNAIGGASGLVQVSGRSAEPLALDGQYLIIGQPVPADGSLTLLAGRPVVAEDSDGVHYFKRLRLLGEDRIVLESLDSGGDYEPLIFSATGPTESLKRVWPVAGILFELPS